jgi:formiminotetrahydrofolate cyclodeaminase
LPKTTDDEKRARTAQLQAALAGAAEAPLAAAGMAAEGLALARRAEALGNTHLVSDVECARAFLWAALEASAANVRINHRFMHDAELVRAQDERLLAILAAARGTQIAGEG